MNHISNFWNLINFRRRVSFLLEPPTQNKFSIVQNNNHESVYLFIYYLFAFLTVYLSVCILIYINLFNHLYIYTTNCVLGCARIIWKHLLIVINIEIIKKERLCDFDNISYICALTNNTQISINFYVIFCTIFIKAWARPRV